MIEEAPVTVALEDLGGGDFRFSRGAGNVDLGLTTNPVECELTIGNDHAEAALCLHGRLEFESNDGIALPPPRHLDMATVCRGPLLDWR